MIPLVLLAGFLGAGKTRFLTDIIPLLHKHGVRVRVVLNDFENADIDAARLASLNAIVTPLNGECVCCATLPELMQTLQSVPPDPGSVLIIEANGATDAVDLLANLTTDRRMAHFTPPMQITVIDATKWQKRWWHNGLERSQTVTATHLFMNWTQKLSADKIRKAELSVREVAPRAAFTSPENFASTLAEVVQQVRDVPQRKTTLPTAPFASDSGNAVHSHDHHAHTFASIAFTLPSEVAREPFLQFVRSLPTEVVRAKGLVRFANEPGVMFVWNRLPDGDRVELDKVTPHESTPPSALFIGVEMPVAEIASRVARLSPGS